MANGSDTRRWTSPRWVQHKHSVSRGEMQSRKAYDGTVRHFLARKSEAESQLSEKAQRNDSVPSYAMQSRSTANVSCKLLMARLLPVCAQLPSGLGLLPEYASLPVPN